MMMRNDEIVDGLEPALSELKGAGLKLNVNDSKLIRELLADLARKVRRSPVEIINSPQLAEILDGDKLNGPQKLTRVKTELAAMRYPVATKAEYAFRSGIKALKLHPNIKISHTPNFEDNRVNVQFKYVDAAQLRAIIRSLEELADHEPIRDALETAEDLS